MADVTREDGYYWCKCRRSGNWGIYYYNSKLDVFESGCFDYKFHASELEIDERRVTRD